MTFTQKARDGHQQLMRAVDQLRLGGATALGPALALALGITSKKPGSKIVLCTDGIKFLTEGAANTGCGQINQGPGFYREAAALARSQGTAVSIVTMEGEDSKMEYLGSFGLTKGTVADISGGQVDVVDPKNMGQSFGSALSRASVATNVELRVILPKELHFEREPKGVLRTATRSMGSAAEGTDLSFHFGFVHKNKV